MSMLKLENCSETQKNQNECKIWSAMCNFFLVSHIKITNFRENYINYTGKNRFNGMPRKPPLRFDIKPGSAHICGAMA